MSKIQLHRRLWIASRGALLPQSMWGTGVTIQMFWFWVVAWWLGRASTYWSASERIRLRFRRRLDLSAHFYSPSLQSMLAFWAQQRSPSKAFRQVEAERMRPPERAFHQDDVIC